MRRTQFFTAVIVAVLTFVSLHLFFGHRYGSPYGWGRGYGFRHYNYYAPYYPDDRYDQRMIPQRDSVWRQP